MAPHMSSHRLQELLRANKLRAKRDYHKAIAIYMGLLQDIQDPTMMYLAIASCYSDLAFTDLEKSTEYARQAIAWLQRALDRRPDDARLHLRLAGYFEVLVFDFEQSAREFRLAVTLAPYDDDVLATAGYGYFHPDTELAREEVITWYERLVEIAPYNEKHHLHLGVLYEEAGRRTDAEKEWSKALLGQQSVKDADLEWVEHLLSKRKPS